MRVPSYISPNTLISQSTWPFFFQFEYFFEIMYKIFTHTYTGWNWFYQAPFPSTHRKNSKLVQQTVKSDFIILATKHFGFKYPTTKCAEVLGIWRTVFIMTRHYTYLHGHRTPRTVSNGALDKHWIWYSGAKYIVFKFLLLECHRIRLWCNISSQFLSEVCQDKPLQA